MASLAKNSIYNTLGIVVYVLLMLIITPLLINAMGDVQYGLFRLALFSVVNYCFLLDMGLSSGILRAFADRYSSGDVVGANKIMGVGIYIFTFINVVISILGVFIVIYFPAFVNTPPEYVFEFRVLLGATILFLIFSFYCTTWYNIFIVGERFDCLQITKLLGRIAFMYASLLLIYLFGSPLLMISVAVLIITPSVFVLSAYLAKKVWPAMSICMAKPEKDVLTGIVTFGGQWFMVTLSGIILMSTTDIIIGRYLGLEYVTFFSIAIMIGAQINSIITSVSVPLYPVASKYGVTGKLDELGKLFDNSIKVSSVIFIFFAFPVCVLMSEILTIWVNPDFAKVAPVAILMVAANAATIFEATVQSILKATGKIKNLTIYYTFFAGVALILIFALTVYLKKELLWIAIVFVVSYLLRSIFVMRYAAKQFNVDWKSLLITLLFKVSVVAILSLPLLYLLKTFILPENIFLLIFDLIISALITFAFSYYIILNREQKDFIIKNSLNFIKKIKGSISF